MLVDLSPARQRTIAALTAAAAQAYGDALAVVDGDIRLSFKALSQAARRAGRAFVAAGVQAGDRVALWAPNSASWIVATLGLQMVGGVLTPLNTRFKGPEAADTCSAPTHACC